MNSDRHSRLVEEALLLKKAWLFAFVMSGSSSKLTEEELTMPNYLLWNNKELKRQIDDLKSDFESVVKSLISNWKSIRLQSRADWCAKKFDEWHQGGYGIFEVGRIHEVERAFGQLRCRKRMDCPPYAQLLVQGLYEPAIRHPEYHLSSDLGLLFNLLLDSEAILDDANRRMEVHSTEHSQSLARSVILTCFNLLESFVSGLATAWLIENPNAPPAVLKKLKDDNQPLKARFVSFPNLILGRTDVIDDKSVPFAPLFGECKHRRDSFVHCEPGPHANKRGFVKEDKFHEANLASARKTVELTCQAITHVWKAIHGKDGPSWLAKRDAQGRFQRVTVRLTPVPKVS